jgi:UDP-glucose 4-epimerase
MPAEPARAMDVLVTGGSGFIGSHVVDQLLAAGHRPRIFDARPSPHHTPDRVPIVVGDLADLDALDAAMDGCDAVVHLAASADVNEVQQEPVEAEQRNARGTLHVLEAARRRSLERVVYASTIWVYSDTPAETHVEALPLHAPAHLYTATKLAGEHYCHAYGELYGVEHTILRFGIPYGPRARPAAVVPAFVNKALAGEPLTIAGDGSQTRRFVYVEDLANGVVRALAPVAAGKTYNLVGSEDTTIREIAETVRDIIGDVELTFTPGRTGDYAGAPVSGDRAAEDLGWTATTPFREGVREYVAWHREAAAAVPAVSERRIAVGALARRAGIAVAWAAATALLVLGVLTLTPVDSNVDSYDTFTTILVMLTPLVLAGGFAWDRTHARGLRAVLWTGSAACLAVAVLPWPHVIDHLGEGHAIVLLLFALVAALAGLVPERRAPLREWIAGVGG